MEIRIRLCLEDDVVKFFRQRFETIEHKLDVITDKETKTMAAIDDLNAAIQAEDVQLTTLNASVTKIDADVETLLTNVNGGAATTQQIQTALTAIQAHTAALATATQQMTDEDNKVNPVTTGNPPPSSSSSRLA